MSPVLCRGRQSFFDAARLAGNNDRAVNGVAH
jgi:hypothetical protein